MDCAIFYRLAHDAAWLVAVGAVVELALHDQLAELGEIPVQLLGLGIPERQGMSPGRSATYPPLFRANSWRAIVVWRPLVVRSLVSRTASPSSG